MDAESLKYYLANLSNAPTQEQRVKENSQLQNYLLFKSALPKWSSEVIEQKIGRAVRLNNTTKLNQLSQLSQSKN